MIVINVQIIYSNWSTKRHVLGCKRFLSAEVGKYTKEIWDAWAWSLGDIMSLKHLHVEWFIDAWSQAIKAPSSCNEACFRCRWHPGNGPSWGGSTWRVVAQWHHLRIKLLSHSLLRIPVHNGAHLSSQPICDVMVWSASKGSQKQPTGLV